MNKPVQIITTPAGERLVVIPEEEYQRLLEAAEELEDILAFEEAMEREKAGEELLTFEEVEEMLEKQGK